MKKFDAVLSVVLLLSQAAFADPIHGTAYDGDHVEVKRLLDGGADLNVANSNGITPLHHAVSQGHTETANFSSRQEFDQTLSGIQQIQK